MSSLDSDGFFNKGVMCDTFKTSRKEPDSEDKLTMFVMGVSNISRQAFNLVGNRSKSQDLSWEERINFLAGSNDVIGKLISGGGKWGTLCLGFQNCTPIFSILLTKKVEKLWQSVVISLVVGIDVLGARCSTKLTAPKVFQLHSHFHECNLQYVLA